MTSPIMDFPCNWPFVQGIHRSPFFLSMHAWINGWVNNLEAGDLRRNRSHYDVITMDQANRQHQWLHPCLVHVVPCSTVPTVHVCTPPTKSLRAPAPNGWPSTQPGSCTQPCPIVDTSVPPLFTQPCPGRTMSTAVCIYVVGPCASCPAV